jgi:hypothetical protein
MMSCSPSFSTITGWLGPDEKKVYEQILWGTNFIRAIKAINPDSEIIIYL